ncbi:MAG: GNAT family N-acetyltransferase [Chloroflexi bacterium]|nr:GNAT family N-acetyltransferase [Chloroflexota bacterium]
MNISLMATDAEREACAQIMALSDPWVTLGYTHGELRERFDAPGVEVYVLTEDERVAAFAVVSMRGILSGYLQSIAVAEAYRGRGLGTALLRFVEERVFREKPNVFLFVSSFNHGARRLYESLGYEMIGTVKDFLVKGCDEQLMRKTIGPLRGWPMADG